MNRKANSETTVSLPMKGTAANFATSSFRFRDSGRFNVSAPHTRCSKVMTLSQHNKQQLLLMCFSILPFPSATESQGEVLRTADPAAVMDPSNKVNQATEMLSEEMKSVFYIYEADFRYLEKVHEAGAGKELL